MRARTLLAVVVRMRARTLLAVVVATATVGAVVGVVSAAQATTAGNWASATRAVGVAVDTTPTVGSVAQFPGGVDGAGAMGHVAWVIGVGGGTVTVEDYNYSDAYDGYTYDNYSQHTVATAGLNLIHFAGVAGPAETWINPATTKFLDLDHGRSTDGTKIQLWSDTGGSAQRWIRVSSIGGYYKFQDNNGQSAPSQMGRGSGAAFGIRQSC